MSLIDNVKDAVRSIKESDFTPYQFIVMTAEQWDTVRSDAHRADSPDLGVYRPDGTKASRVSFTGSALMGTPVLIREVGADISAIPTPVLDLRGVTA
jgi:hypothetical protein